MGNLKDDEIIAQSMIHKNIKGDFTFWDDNYEWETDFMFGFIESMMKRLNMSLPDDEDDDHEWKCYEWCVNYFGKYLDITSDIITESGYILYTKDKDERNELCKEYRSFTRSNEPLNLTLDCNVLNEVQGHLYFDK